MENAQETHRRVGGQGRLKKFRGRRLVTRLFVESFRIMSNSRDGDFFFFFFAREEQRGWSEFVEFQFQSFARD